MTLLATVDIGGVFETVSKGWTAASGIGGAILGLYRWRRKRLVIETWPVATFDELRIVYNAGLHLFNASGRTVFLDPDDFAIEFRARGEKRQTTIVPWKRVPADRIEPEASSRGLIDLARFGKLVPGGDDGERGIYYRVRVRLGNGARRNSRWTFLPPSRLASQPGGGHQSDF